MSVSSGAGAAIAIAVDDAVDPSTVVPVLTGNGEVTDNVMLTFNAGDVLTVQNYSGFTLTTVPGSVGAQLTIMSLG